MSAKKNEKEKRVTGRCEWVNGFVNPRFSGLEQCRCPARFAVWAYECRVGKVCAGHANQVIQQHFQVRS